jgi:hypothetical protein
MKGCLKALTGLMLVFIVHLPRFLYQLLLLSYAYVFNNQENLTADPNVHLKRARKLLKGQNSQILYAAIEVRFALERMTYRELSMTEKVSNNERKEYSPVKHIKSLRRADDNTQYPHKIFLINKSTGEHIEWGEIQALGAGSGKANSRTFR